MKAPFVNINHIMVVEHYKRSNNMPNSNKKYPCSYCEEDSKYDLDLMDDMYDMKPYQHHNKKHMNNSDCMEMKLKDYGPQPFVINIEEATKENKNFRTALWTGKHLQLTLMSIPVGGEIGLEIHPHLDQFIRIEEGEGLVMMGERKNCLDFRAKVCDDFAFIIPAGTWHNLINTGKKPIKLYSIYAPPQHPRGTVHKTKADADAAEHDHRYYEEYEQNYTRQPRKFTLNELAQFDGIMGSPAYVAIKGIVYDVSNNPRWRKAMDLGLAAGEDLTPQLRGYSGIEEKLSDLPKVGILIE